MPKGSINFLGMIEKSGFPLQSLTHPYTRFKHKIIIIPIYKNQNQKPNHHKISA